MNQQPHSDDKNILVKDADVRRLLEARNGLLQFDELRKIMPNHFGKLALNAELVQRLQAIAVKDIRSDAGYYRHHPVYISNSPHQPPPWEEVAGLVDEMCDYANGHATPSQSLHCSAYLLWRLNWIHPFGDGNGRTSRAVSYLALCACYSLDLPGTVTVVDLLAARKQPYYAALDAADVAWKSGNLDVSRMEGLLSDLLAKQLKTSV